jgi:hypothetical protein
MADLGHDHVQAPPPAREKSGKTGAGWLIGGVAAAVALGAAVGIAVGTRRWKRDSAAAIGRLYAPGHAPAEVSGVQPEDLPEPVERYFRFALTAGQPLVRHAFIRWGGELLMFGSSGWRPFSAEQHFSGNPPGFVWDASVRAAPFLSAHVRDSYVDGAGASEASVTSLVPLKGQRGIREVAEASLMRYLAEAVWLPTALLPRPGLSWSAIAADTARATLTDRGIAVAVDFRFGAGGEIVSCSADRHRAVGDKTVLTPWRGFYRNYRWIEGMMVPMAAEVAWVLSGQPTPVWRGYPIDIEYEFTDHEQAW